MLSQDADLQKDGTFGIQFKLQQELIYGCNSYISNEAWFIIVEAVCSFESGVPFVNFDASIRALLEQLFAVYETEGVKQI
ncbi:MAG: hypothetical protein EZS28_027745 [Streblomastix strix]|uniref:Uncharacterized protein n=1 Tax=Streblomastix strix TaxID=222440 RepID=A0A5J4V290_9EUKA|nr:MAG: hypothetical protein EZS28_027745 [Streblomastix strix]